MGFPRALQGDLQAARWVFWTLRALLQSACAFGQGQHDELLDHLEPCRDVATHEFGVSFALTSGFVLR